MRMTMTNMVMVDGTLVHHEATKPRRTPESVVRGEPTIGATAQPAPGLLRLMAWLSPAFPTGAFAYSHGLEWAVEAGDVISEASLLAWLLDVVASGAARSDAILLRQAYRCFEATEMLMQVAGLAYAMAPGRERQSESLNQGQAFMLAAAPWGVPAAGERLPYPVAVGAVAGMHGVDEDLVAAAYLQAFTANLISAAVRLVPLGQTAGLRVLAAMEPVILAVAGETKTAGPDDLGGCAFRSDLASMRHETQYTRLFRS